MPTRVTPAARAARPFAPLDPQPRADRAARRQETAPLHVPVTAAFIGLLLMRDTGWAEDTAATTPAGGGARGVELPPGADEIAAAHARPGLGDGAQLALDGGDRTAAAPAAAATTVARFVQRGEAAAARADGDVFQLGGDGRAIDVTLEGLQIQGAPTAFGAGGIPAGEAELVATEATHFDGAGYLAQIEDVQLGGDGDDTLTGTPGNDYISGNDGADTIAGGAGDDTLHGDAGDDTVGGGPGHDNVYGDAGDDDLDGGDGSDLVHGGTGDDRLQGGDGADWGFDNLYGGFGADTYLVNHLSDVPDESWVAGDGVDDFRVTSRFIDDFTGTKPYFTAADSFAQLPGDVAAGDHVHVSRGIENVFLEGAWDADIYGGGGDNVLVGNAGANTIKGFAGDDTLDGRGGENRLEGGRGADTYLVDTTLDGVATIVDGDGPSALTANTLRLKGVDRADLAIAGEGDTVTFHTGEVLRARIEGYDAQGPVFHVATDDARFDLLIARPFPEWSPTDTEQALDFEGDLFVDVDLGDDAQVGASLFGGAEVPGWLKFQDHANRFEASPPSEAAGLYVVELTATDTQGLSADASFVLNVGGTSPDAYEVTEDTTRTFRPPWDRFSEIDLTQVERLEMTRADGTALPEWISFDAETGRVTAAPGNADTGEVAVRFTATDATGVTETADLAIVANQTNDEPVANIDVARAYATEDVAFSWTADGEFTDVDPGDAVSVHVDDAELPSWLDYDRDTQIFTGTPREGDDGTVEIGLVGRDQAGAEATSRLVVDVKAVNDPPETANVPDMVQHLRSEDLAPGGPYTYQLPADLFTDPDDGDSLTLSARSLVNRAAVPEGFGFDPATGTFSADRPRVDVEPFEVEITATDQSGARGCATVTLDVDVVNRPPVLELDERRIDVDGYEKQPFVWEPDTAWFMDADGDALRFEARLTDGSALPGWLSVDPATGALEGTPPETDPSEGVIAIELRAIDPFGATLAVHHRSNGEDHYISTPLDIRLDIHDPEPVWNKSLPDMEVREDEVTTITIPEGAVFDPDSDPLVFSASLDPNVAHPLPDWLTFDPVTRELVASPQEGDPRGTSPEPVTVWITATEDIPGGVSTSTGFDIEVKAVNDATEVVKHTLVADEGREDAEYGWSLPADAFTDEENDPLDFEIRDGTLPDWLEFDPRTGRFTSDDPEPFVGDGHTLRTSQDTEGAITHWADYEIRAGAVDSGDAASEEAITVTLAVAQENDAPTVDADVAAGFADHVVRQDDPLVTVVPEDLFVDPEGDVFTLEAMGPEGEPLPDWLSFDGEKFIGIPGRDDVADFDVNLTATDVEGASSTVELSIVVDNVNDAPVVAAPFADVTLAEGERIRFEPAAHFADPEGDDLSLHVAGAGGEPLPSWLAFDADENRLEVIAGADAAAFGHRQFNTIDVEVVADDGELATTTGFAVEIEPLPDLLHTPRAERFTADTAEDFDHVTLTGRFTQDPTAELQATAAGEPWPDWLQFDPKTGAFTGRPKQGDVGEIRVEITARDAAGHVDQESFVVDVEPGNAPPVVVGGAAHRTVTKDTFTHDLPSRYFADPDAADVLTIEARLADGAPLPDWLSFDPDGLTFAATRQEGEAGPLAIELTATDRAGESVTSPLTVDVEFGPNLPPILELDEPTRAASAFEEQPFRWRPDPAWFTEEEGEALHFEATLADGGALPAWLDVDSDTGAVTGTPEAADAGTLAIELWAVDPYGERSSVYEQIEQPEGSLERGAVETPVRLELDVRENTPPVWAEALHSHTVTEDEPTAAFAIPADAVVDADGDPLAFSARRSDGRELPDWLSFDPIEGRFIPLPTTGDPAEGPATVTLRLTAHEDRAGGDTASTNFDLTVEPVNDAPEFVQSVGRHARSAVEGQGYSWQLPHGVFVDEEGDALNYEAVLVKGQAEQPLPDWLHFDAETGTFWTDDLEPVKGDGHRATSEVLDDGEPVHWAHYDLRVTASDGDGTSADPLDLTFKVRTVNDPPEVTGTIENQKLRQDDAWEFKHDRVFTDPEHDDL